MDFTGTIRHGFYSEKAAELYGYAINKEGIRITAWLLSKDSIYNYPDKVYIGQFDMSEFENCFKKLD